MKLSQPREPKPSRQTLWQRAQVAAHRCRQCAKPEYIPGWCESCLDKHRTAMRKRYRIKAGIPLDAPVRTTKPRLLPL